MSPYEEMLKGYNTDLHNEEVAQIVEKIIRENISGNATEEVYRFLFGCLDFTSLNPTDNQTQIAAFTRQVNEFDNQNPELNHVAAICVYPNFVECVRMNLDLSDVNIAAVAGGFPSAQTFSEVKIAEVALAVADGANEIDMVMNVGQFLNGEYEDICDEIVEIKRACREKARLKVILETGALGDYAAIKKASLLAIYSGADFIKTSTGKLSPGATPEAFYVMCTAIKEYYEKNHIRIGIKAAGGISTTAEALKYYTIAQSVLGPEWLNKEYFRIGASRLASSLVQSILEIRRK
ncbi:MAG: deoxyribose-phosphate aldolase [Porphyromonadaceae bacterium]|nr:deoxyribose-phosphate aldolase [Porphyromonadaceae bacterium]